MNCIWIILKDKLYLNSLSDFLGEYYFILLFILFYRKFLILRMQNQKESKSNLLWKLYVLLVLQCWMEYFSGFPVKVLF